MSAAGRGDLAGRQTDVKIKVEKEIASYGCIGLSFPLWLEHVTPLKTRAGYWGGNSTAFFKSSKVESKQKY